jgi:putative transposase
MLLTYKIRHDRDFLDELAKAKRVAQIGIDTRTLSSADVRHVGLKSMIANQILRKYSRDRKAKRAHRVNLIVPNQGIKVDKESCEIYIPCLKHRFHYQFRNDFEKVNQIEINSEYMFVTISIPDDVEFLPEGFVGIDLNVTGHCTVMSDPSTGVVKKMGKSANHIHRKYRQMRRRLQKQKRYKKTKTIRNRESRIIRDMNHKISRELVNYAYENNRGIALEALGNIRNNVNTKQEKLPSYLPERAQENRQRHRYGLNSWSFAQLQTMIEYKAKLLGVPVRRVSPQYTSQDCSRCGQRGVRELKSFKCPHCGHVDHADANAAFNIAIRGSKGYGQSIADRDAVEGSTDTPQEALVCVPY